MRHIIPRLGHNQRKTQLEEYYGVRTSKEIALNCGVHRNTINRDIKEWKLSGEYDEWLDQRWHQLLESGDISDTVKFTALTRLKEKRMIKRQLVRTEVKGEIKHSVDKKLRSTLEKYSAIIEALNEE